MPPRFQPQLKTFFSWWNQLGGLLFWGLSTVSLACPVPGSPFCHSFWGAEPHWAPGVGDLVCPPPRCCWGNNFSWRCSEWDRAMASEQLLLGMGGYVCARTRFWGPSLTSGDWEKFTYTAHFHMSQLRLAEATICAAAWRSGFFPAQRQQGFDLPHGCFVAAHTVISLQYFFFSPFPSPRHHLTAAPLLPPAPSHRGG